MTNEHERMVEEMGRKFNNDLAFQLKPSNDTIAAVRAARKLFEETLTTLITKVREETLKTFKGARNPGEWEDSVWHDGRKYEREKILDFIAGNHKGAFTDDVGNNCWYTDELLSALTNEV